MPMNKPHLEFHHLDMDNGWATPPGYPTGIKQKILASDLDETAKMGSRTRLLRFDPGVYTTAPFVHDHWEEVYLVSGDLIVGNDENGMAAKTSARRPTPAVRRASTTGLSSRRRAASFTNSTITTRARSELRGQPDLRSCRWLCPSSYSSCWQRSCMRSPERSNGGWHPGRLKLPPGNNEVPENNEVEERSRFPCRHSLFPMQRLECRMKLAVPDMISNSYFPAIAAIELGFFKEEGLDVELEMIFPR